MEKHAPQNGWFFIRFVAFTSTLVGWLISLLPGVGWDIIGYESEPLLSYPELRNCSYSVNLITPLPRLFLRFIYRVFIPPLHHMARPRHPLRLLAQCIDGASRHPLRYGCLPSFDVHSDGLDPRSAHCLIYRWVLPLYACPAIFRYPCDLLCRPMMERRQDLDHLPIHHPALAYM